MKGIRVHEKGRYRGDRDRSDMFLGRRCIMISFLVEGGRKGGIIGMGLGVGNGSRFPRDKIQNLPIIGATIHRMHQENNTLLDLI